MTNKHPVESVGQNKPPTEAKPDFDMAELLRKRKARYAAQAEQAKKDIKEASRQEAAREKMAEHANANRGE